MKRKELKRHFLSLTILILTIISTASFSFASHLNEVRAGINAAGRRWIAAETSVSKLSDHEKTRRLGLFKGTVTGGERLFVTQDQLSASLPESLDWRSNGGNFVTSVKNQGNCGSCWAFAATAALESHILIKDNLPGTNDNRAEQILVSCSGAGSCDGGYIDSAAQYVKTTGLPVESYFPYTASDSSCSSAQAGWQNYTYKTYSWQFVTTTSTSVDLLRSALYTYGPLITTMDVYSDFYYYSGGVYEYTSGSYLGGHAILLIGYVDDSSISGGGYFILKNSWGTYWGESGYFKVAYSEIGYPVYFGDWTIAYRAQTIPTPAAPSNLVATVVSGSQIDLSWTDNSDNEAGFKIESCQGVACTTFSQIANVGANVTKYSHTSLAAGTSYTYRVRAYNSGGNSSYTDTDTATLPSNDSSPHRLLLTHSSGQVSLRRLDSADNWTSGYTNYGPYSGWIATSYHRNSDGTGRLLWAHTSGMASLWRLDSADNWAGGYTGYGPYSGWTAKSYHRNSDGTGRLLWTHTSGAVSLWRLDAADNCIGGSAYGPYSGWTAKSYHRNSDGTGRLLWTHTSGAVSIWRLDSADNWAGGYTSYGPYSGWTATDYCRNADGTGRLLWTHTSGVVSLWQLDSADNWVGGHTGYGPYSGWAGTSYQ